ncbi:MAG TPA: hypothetical protein VGK48_13360 [Terriglobia bacterium]
MPALIETFAAELERPRELSPRVLNYITGTYNLDPSEVGVFLVDKLPAVDDVEIDLILSPVFTPKLEDQAVFAGQLGAAAVPREQWPGIVEQLAARPVRARLVTPDSQAHVVPLRDVTIERYVHRLRLEAVIPESLFTLLERLPAPNDRPMLRAIARRSAWESGGPREILEQYLSAVIKEGSYSLDDMFEMLNLAEGRKPANVQDLLAAIPRWTEALREQIDKASGPKAFFHPQVEMMHGGGRDQRGADSLRASAKENELAFLLRLQGLLSV